jgi:hypothetical protein
MDWIKGITREQEVQHCIFQPVSYLDVPDQVRSRLSVVLLLMTLYGLGRVMLSISIGTKLWLMIS